MNNKLFAEEKVLRNGFIAKRIGYKWGLYDNEDNVLMRQLYDYISIDQEGRIWARFKGKKFFVEDNKLPYPFDFIHDSKTDKEWYVIESNGCLGIMDKQHNIKIPLQYRYIVDYGGVLWCSNERIRKDSEKGLLDYLADCLLFSYKGNCITETKYDLHIGSSDRILIPSFPVIGNKDGFNILNNDKKVVLPTLAKTINKINDWLIIQFEKEQLLYNIENNYFIDNHKYSKITYLREKSIGRTDIFICKRLSDERTCDVYKGGKLIATYDSFSYSLFDVADEFIIVSKRWFLLSSENMLPKYGFINNKGLVVPCLYDRITVNDGAISIVIAEVFEETSKKYVDNAVYVEHHSSRIPNFYVSKGRYDVFAFDGHCICEDNDIITSNVIWRAESDSFFIQRKEKSLVEQYDLTGSIKTFHEIQRAYWGVIGNKGLNLINKDCSVIYLSCSNHYSKNKEKTENVKKPEQIIYSAELIAKELSNSDYCPIAHNDLLDNQSIDASNKDQNKEDHVFHEGLSPIIKDGKWGYLNEMGEIIIPFEYDEAEPFSDGLAAVRKGDFFGYIDYNNNIIIDFKFVKVWPFDNGLAKFDNSPDYNPNITDEGYLSKDGIYIDYVFKQWKYDYNYDRPDYGRETWGAMTDGMYGDYPGSGFDYDTIGFGI